MMDTIPPTTKRVDSMPTTPSRFLSPVRTKNSISSEAGRGKNPLTGDNAADTFPMASSRRRSVEDVSEDDVKKLHAAKKAQSSPSDDNNLDRSPALSTTSSSSSAAPSPTGTVDNMPKPPTRCVSEEIPEDIFDSQSSPGGSLGTSDDNNVPRLQANSRLLSSAVLKEDSPDGILLDNAPTLPSRFMSCEIPEDCFEADNDPQYTAPDDKEGILSKAVRVVKSSPLEPIVEPEFDVRAEVLSRIPQHIKGQLTLKEWHRILEPTMWNGTRPDDSATVCSDFTDGFSVPSNRSENTQSSRSISPCKAVYDDVYGADEENLTVRHTRDDRAAKTEEVEMVKTRKRDDRADLGRKTEDIRRSSRLDTHLAGYTRSEMDILQRATSPAPLLKKRVSFGNAQVRWHERVLEIHPCTSSGPSIGIGWKYYTESEEAIKWKKRKRRFVLTRREREKIVADLGYSRRAIAKAIRKNLKVKNRRRRTINNLQANMVNVQRVEYTAEKCRRKIRKLHKKLRWAASQ